ncbi:MAG: hypothetical protein HZA47_09030 [Planctomycetes bacterium]|uniref:hypothetical protein n=1 Tax=Candidatus Wunengus sp. YC65 TaxID=3367701 RepID=UPI001DDBCC30|nr:hypothetical protein [Planctomycetota bacterium]
MTEPAHKILVRKYLDWEKVSNRLSRYEYIGKHYNLKALQDCSEKSPYYCHYLAWRLGTWEYEKSFTFFNELLKHGILLPNWDKKIKAEDPSKRYEYEKFFYFLWELQVAKFFSDVKGVSVEWTLSGPDLKISSNGKTFYIECYTFIKSFGIELFIEDLLNRIHPRIRTLHTSCIKFSLPQNADTEKFLNDIFSPYLNPCFIDNKLKKAEKEWPVLLPTPQGIDNFYIYVEGNNQAEYISGRLPNASGIPENYLAVCFKEAINAKRNSNELSQHSNVLLAINFLLSTDFQGAANRQKELNELCLSEEIPLCDFGNAIDGIFFSACGINGVPSLENSYLKIKAGIEHPILSLDEKFNLLSAKGDSFFSQDGQCT